MRKGGVRNSWCPTAMRNFLLFASGLLVSFPYAMLLEVAVAQRPGGGDDSNNVMFKCMRVALVGLACLPVLPCYAFYAIVLWWHINASMPRKHWLLVRAAHFGAGFCQGMNLLYYVLNFGRAISSKEEDEEESPAEGSASAGYTHCLAFAISVWHALLWVWVLIKEEQ
jgi:hypothetical protein